MHMAVKQQKKFRFVRTLPKNIIYMHIGMVASIEHTHDKAVQTVMNEYKKQSH